MTISSLSSKIIHLDQNYKYIPILSTFTNLFVIFKKLVIDCSGQTNTNSNHYFEYLKAKSYMRCAILTVPLIGNLAVFLYDQLKSPSNDPIALTRNENENSVLQPAHFYQPLANERSSAFKARIFQQTVRASEQGYRNSSLTAVPINNEPMLRETITYDQIAPLPPIETTYQTNFSVIPEDTFQVMLRRRSEGSNPLGINMANRYRPGGGVEHGAPAQEEALCRSSNHILGLRTQTYPLPETGGIYCPHVQIFRKNEANGFAFMDQPVEVALVAVAAYNLSFSSSDRVDLGLPPAIPLSPALVENCPLFIDGTKNKIRNMLRSAAIKGHIDLVLGALGCGAFQNPPTTISSLFAEIFNEIEFKGRFRQVDFAILRLVAKDQDNIMAFNGICERMNAI